MEKWEETTNRSSANFHAFWVRHEIAVQCTSHCCSNPLAAFGYFAHCAVSGLRKMEIDPGLWKLGHFSREQNNVALMDLYPTARTPKNRDRMQIAFPRNLLWAKAQFWGVWCTYEPLQTAYGPERKRPVFCDVMKKVGRLSCKPCTWTGSKAACEAGTIREGWYRTKSLTSEFNSGSNLKLTTFQCHAVCGEGKKWTGRGTWNNTVQKTVTSWLRFCLDYPKHTWIFLQIVSTDDKSKFDFQIFVFVFI